jgi:hypothetical protein
MMNPRHKVRKKAANSLTPHSGWARNAAVNQVGNTMNSTATFKKVGLMAGLATLAINVQGATLLGPTAYLSSADSPWAAYIGTSIVLEDFEDGALNVAGVTASIGDVIPPGWVGLIDSVDADDGVIDGSGLDGHSWFTLNPPLTFDFTTSATLPTHVGIVWTDGGNDITFEAFDNLGVSLGTVVGTHADGVYTGTTAEDRFYGAINAAGISKITFGASGGIEVDHLQFGTVPEPATCAMFAGLGLMAFAGYRRARK